MEGLGNIVYVVAAIAWFAWSAYKKSQDGKKKPTRASRTRPAGRQVVEEHEEPRSFEDMILEQFGQKKPEPVRVETEKRSNEGKFLNTDRTHSHLPEDYKMSKSEMKSHRVERQVTKLKVVELDQESLMDELLPNGFDLKQAVVLNAILERPYK